MDDFNQHFKNNPNADSYFANVDVDGNLKSLLALVAQARKIKKAVYLFSTDLEGSKITHVNYLPEHQVREGFDAKAWASAVTEVIGGRVCSLIELSPRKWDMFSLFSLLLFYRLVVKPTRFKG